MSRETFRLFNKRAVVTLLICDIYMLLMIQAYAAEICRKEYQALGMSVVRLFTSPSFLYICYNLKLVFQILAITIIVIYNFLFCR